MKTRTETAEDSPAQAWYERLDGERLGEECYTADGTQVVEVGYGWSDIQMLF